MKFNFLCLVVLAAAVVGLPTRAADTALPTATQQARRFESTVQHRVSLPYLLFQPQGYSATGEKRWPLMIFLHGAGERGTNIQAVTVHGPPKLVKTRQDFPFVLVSPQCAEGKVWKTEDLDALLEELLATHAIDPHRVYLTGLSMGGYGTWAWAVARPDRFAAIAPICGGGNVIDLLVASGQHRKDLSRLPVWAFHGAKDNVVPLSESERMVDAFKKTGSPARLTVYPEAGHDSWTAAYDDPALFTWMLAQKRP